MGPPFATLSQPPAHTLLAPDGSRVRVLLGLPRGGLALFELAPGQVSQAVRHRTVEELWYVLGGAGELWRRQDEREEVTPLVPGACLSLPLGACFQFRNRGHEPLVILGATMPPWPGGDEAEPVSGPWPATTAPLDAS